MEPGSIKNDFSGQKSGEHTAPFSLWKLFTSCLAISSCTFGGGFVIVTFMKRKFVDQLGWLDEQEMLDLVAIAQSSPGAIAVNAAILVGWQTAGLSGMLAAVAGTIIPPIVILSVISQFYNAFATNIVVALMLKGMQAGAAAIILDVVFSLGQGIWKQKSLFYNLTFLCAFLAAFSGQINVIWIIIACAICGVVYSLIKEAKSQKHNSPETDEEKSA